MSLDLYNEPAQDDRLSTAPIYTRPTEVGTFDGFARGAGMEFVNVGVKTMSGLALGLMTPMVGAAHYTGNHEISDRLLKMHEDIFEPAIDYWTPKPDEVGVAGRIVGTLLGAIPAIMAAPAPFLFGSSLEMGRDLTKQGVDPYKASAAAAGQAAGLGLGLHVPIFGTTLLQRTLLGGMGFNVLQGATMRGMTALAAEGSPVEGQIDVLDPTELTIDALMGLAFGGAAHFIPSWRAQGTEFWRAMMGEDWGRIITPEQRDSLLTLRAAQHLTADSLPGLPHGPKDLQAHVERLRAKITSLVTGEPANVEDGQPANFQPDPARVAEHEARAVDLQHQGRALELDRVDTPRQYTGGWQPETPRDGDVPLAEQGKLAADQLEVERVARAELMADPQGFVQRYLESNGLVVNTDEARKLFQRYNETPQTRARHSASVHESASWIAKQAYTKLLTDPLPAGKDPLVVFTAGGTGAGKSSSVTNTPVASEIQARARAIYDTNLSGFDSGVKKINQALDGGNVVTILYVHVDPVDAAGRAAERAANEESDSFGRTVPIEEHVNTHVGANQVIRQLALHYANDPRVRIFALDNRVPKGAPADVIRLTDLPQLEYNTLEAEAIAHLTEKYRNGQIPDWVYNGFVNGSGGSADAAAASDPRLGEFALSHPGARVVAAKRREERAAAATARPGALRVFRVGSGGPLGGKNAGDLQAVALHLVRLDDFEAPQPQGAHRSDTVTVYDVPEQAQYGHYVAYSGGRAENPEREHNLVGRTAQGGNRGTAYSFPPSVVGSTVLTLPIAEIRAKLRQLHGFDNFDDAGGNLTREAIEALIAEKAPNGPPVPVARSEPPPPPQRAGGEAPASPAGPQVMDLNRLPLAGEGVMTAARFPPVIDANAPRRALVGTVRTLFGDGPLVDPQAPAFPEVNVFLNYDLPSLGATHARRLTPAQEAAGVPRVGAIEVNPTSILSQAELLGNRYEDELRGVLFHELAHARRVALGRDVSSPEGIARAEASGDRAQAHGARGATPADPLTAEATRWATENPDKAMVMGYDNNGEPLVMRVADYLADEQRAVQQAQADAPLFQLAAQCLLGA